MKKASSQVQKGGKAKPATTKSPKQPLKKAKPSPSSAKAKPAATKSPKQKTQSPKIKQRKAKDEDEFDSDDGEDIGDVFEYMKGKDSDDESGVKSVVEFDDGEVSLNLPQKQKKTDLFASDSEEEDKSVAIDKAKTKLFSDQNKSLLKPKRKISELSSDDSEEEEGSDGEGDVDKRLQARIDKVMAVKEQEEVDKKAVAEEMRAQAKAEAEESDEEEEEEEGLEDIANRMENLSRKIQDSVATLTDWKERKPAGVARESFVTELKGDMMSYFGYTQFLMDLYFHLFTPAEVLNHIEANEVPRPLTIRVNTMKAVRRDVAQTLINKGVSIEPVKWSKVGLVIYESKVPIGATPEYLAGHYMLQSAASFLPVLALDPQPGEHVMDMCAAPGGKTTYIAALMKNTGHILANDKNPDRIHALVANMHRLGVRNGVVSCEDGIQIGKTAGHNFDRVLLDAPCMGLGVISKDRSIKSSKEEKDLITCIDIQIKLLLAAIDVVDVTKAAVIVYSTCSISVEENEAIVNKALKKRYVKVVETGLEFGREGITSYRGKTFHPSLKLAKRYYPHAHNIDGFFVCKLQKLQHGIKKKEESNDIELMEHRAPLILKKNVKKLNEGKLIFADEDHTFDVEKEKLRAQKNKGKAHRKKQSRLARMRANAEDDDEEMEEPAPKPSKPAKIVNPTKPAENGNAKKGTTPVKGNQKGTTPQKRLRGSKN